MLFYSGYLDFWFTDRPLVARVEPFVALEVRDFCVFAWRQAPLAELAAECRRQGARIFSTFDADMGALADPADNETTLRTWAESLEKNNWTPAWMAGDAFASFVDQEFTSLRDTMTKSGMV